MELLQLAESHRFELENKLDAAKERLVGAELAAMEAAGEVRVIQGEYDRLRDAISVMKGEKPVTGESRVAHVEEARRDASPVLPPKAPPRGPACPSCGEVGTLGPFTTEIKGKTITVTACSQCSHQVW